VTVTLTFESLAATGYLVSVGFEAQLRAELGEASGLAVHDRLLIAPGPPRRLSLVPIGPGEPRTLAHEGIDAVTAAWFADGRRLLLAGAEAGAAPRLYVVDLGGGAPRAVTPAGVWREPALSPDGTALAVLGADDRIWLYPAAGGAAEALKGTTAAERPARFTADGRSLYVYDGGSWPARVTRIELASGKRTPWRELRPPDAASCAGIIGRLLITPDGASYAYTYDRSVADLFLMSGLR